MHKSLNVLKPVYDTGSILESIKETLESGWTGDGGKTKELEESWRSFSEWHFNIYVNSCTAALHLALLALKEKYPAKSKVLVPDITFVSTAAVVKQCGLDLVLVDVDKDLIIELDSVEDTDEEDTLAVIYVGIGGNTKNLKELSRVCERKKIKLVVDAAHMGGSRLEDKKEISKEVNIEFACYSFQAVKNIGIADSGMICFNEKEYLSEIKKYRWMGISETTYERTIGGKNSYKWEYEIDRLGYKYNGNALVAACCLTILKKADEQNEHRRCIRNKYMEELTDCDKVDFIVHDNESETSGHLAQILLNRNLEQKKRNEFIGKLNSKLIYPGVHYRPLSLSKYYSIYGGKCKKSKNIGERIVSLPCHLDISMDDVKYISDWVKEYA